MSDDIPLRRTASRRGTAVARPSTVFTDVDFGRAGKQIGFFHVPQSPHDDAWGTVRIPLAVVKNGDGPTVLIEGGNHGDEYEGPIALGEFIREIDPGRVQGTIIAIPAINAPAVAAGLRTSPVDGLNFNRTFPGDPAGTLTRQLSAYVHDHLFSEADVFLDLHSGGSSLMIMPSAIVEPAASAEHLRRNIAATLAFGAPTTVMVDNLGEPRTSTASAVAAGLTVVGTEMAGAGTVTREALDICRRGIRNVLAHVGVIEGAAQPALRGERPVLKVPGSDAYVLAPEAGVFEPAQEPGERAVAGEVAGRIHFLLDPGRPPLDLRHKVDGIVFAKRQPGRVVPGNCCMVVAQPFDGAAAP